MNEPKKAASPAPSPSRCYASYRDSVIHGIGVALGVPAIMPGEYKNPFDFLTEFDEWFEFEKRRHFDKQTTYEIVRLMLRDDPTRASRAMDANYTALKRMANEQFGTYRPDGRAFLVSGSS